MTFLVLPLLMIWVGVKVNMPLPFYAIIIAVMVGDLVHAAYKAGKDDEYEEQ